VPSWRGHARGTSHRQPSDLPIARNLLDRGFSATAPNQVWLADITYIETDQGSLYLAAVMDLYSCRIVGWAMAERQPAIGGLADGDLGTAARPSRSPTSTSATG
jgi:transposase InsO family protein